MKYFVHAYSKDIDIAENFTFFDCVVHNDGGSSQEIMRRIDLTHGVIYSLNTSFWSCRYMCRQTKILIFKLLVIPVLLFGYEMYTEHRPEETK